MIKEPLANKLRPVKLNDMIGQEHLIGKDKVIYNLIKNNKMFSCILYGPPGVGKTTLASVISNELKYKTRFLNAVIDSKKDFEIVFEETKLYGTILLVVDEIHRLNKDKQDLLLPRLESGSIILIGITTLNPYHSINPAIRSRLQIYELKKLNDKDILKGLKKAVKLLDNCVIGIKELNYISSISNGDLRYAYNILEVLYYSCSNKIITMNDINNLGNKANVLVDKNDNEYYDILSAFQKSIRGSSVDASLHYLSRLIIMGDLESIYRRLSVIVYEDIGLANPLMAVKLDACINACERVGLPEARIPLSTIVIDMALSPKSNSSYMAIDASLKDIESGNTPKVPDNISAHEIGYKYPFNYPNNYVKQDYLPEDLKNKRYYKPQNNKYEILLKQTLNNIDKINNK